MKIWTKRHRPEIRGQLPAKFAATCLSVINHFGIELFWHRFTKADDYLSFATNPSFLAIEVVGVGGWVWLCSICTNLIHPLTTHWHPQPHTLTHTPSRSNQSGNWHSKKIRISWIFNISRCWIESNFVFELSSS
jgi:hypothetical protein